MSRESAPVTIYAAVGEDPKASLPTYHTVADVLEKKNGSGWRLAGWTVARTFLIAPPMAAVGVPWKQAFAGAALASGMISLFTLIRISDAGSRDDVVVGGGAVASPGPQRQRGSYV